MATHILKVLKKMKWKVFIGAVACFLMIFVLLFFLTRHLYSIQIPERLRYVKDYEEFTLSVDVVHDCTNQIYSFFQQDDVIYQGLCVREVYVNYGKTKAPLELVLKEGYISLSDIQKKLNKIRTFAIAEDLQASFNPPGYVLWYDYRRSEKDEENYLVTVSTKNYPSVTLTEVTFEPFFD